MSQVLNPAQAEFHTLPEIWQYTSFQDKLKTQLQRSQQKDSPQPKFYTFSSDWPRVLNCSTFRAISHLCPWAIWQHNPAGFPQTSHKELKQQNDRKHRQAKTEGGVLRRKGNTS